MLGYADSFGCSVLDRNSNALARELFGIPQGNFKIQSLNMFCQKLNLKKLSL